jgi:hypothetical protein
MHPQFMVQSGSLTQIRLEFSPGKILFGWIDNGVVPNVRGQGFDRLHIGG